MKVTEEEIRKKYSAIRKRIINNSKQRTCLLCGSEQNGYCNSHAIPRFVLKNIGLNGMIYTSNIFRKMPILDTEKGVANSSVFHRICEKCDNEFFKEYESEDALVSHISNKIMNLIDTKNTLKSLHNKYIEMSCYKTLSDTFSIDSIKIFLSQIDIDELLLELEEDKVGDTKYINIFSKILNYKCPIAFQGKISLIGDHEGNLINNPYNFKDNYRMEYINVSVYPLSCNKTLILMFCKQNAKRYKKFIKSFSKLSLNDKLKLITSIIFAHADDYYISKTLSNNIIDDPVLRSISFYDRNNYSGLCVDNTSWLMEYKKAPNIFDIKYKV